MSGAVFHGRRGDREQRICERGVCECAGAIRAEAQGRSTSDARQWERCEGSAVEHAGEGLIFAFPATSFFTSGLAISTGLHQKQIPIPQDVKPFSTIHLRPERPVQLAQPPDLGNPNPRSARAGTCQSVGRERTWLESGLRWQILVSTVAERRIGGVLALAPPNGFFLGDFVFHIKWGQSIRINIMF